MAEVQSANEEWKWPHAVICRSSLYDAMLWYAISVKWRYAAICRFSVKWCFAVICWLRWNDAIWPSPVKCATLWFGHLPWNARTCDLAISHEMRDPVIWPSPVKCHLLWFGRSPVKCPILWFCRSPVKCPGCDGRSPVKCPILLGFKTYFRWYPVGESRENIICLD